MKIIENENEKQMCDITCSLFGVFQVVKLILPVDMIESGVLVSAES